MRPRFCLNQLAGYPHFTCGLAYAPFEHIANAKLAPDLLDVDSLTLVGKRRIACDHEQRLETRQRRDDVFHHAVGEILLLWIATHVLERKHSDGRLVGESERGGR